MIDYIQFELSIESDVNEGSFICGICKKNYGNTRYFNFHRFTRHESNFAKHFGYKT